MELADKHGADWWVSHLIPLDDILCHLQLLVKESEHTKKPLFLAALSFFFCSYVNKFISHFVLHKQEQPTDHDHHDHADDADNDQRKRMLHFFAHMFDDFFIDGYLSPTSRIRPGRTAHQKT